MKNATGPSMLLEEEPPKLLDELLELLDELLELLLELLEPPELDPPPPAKPKPGAKPNIMIDKLTIAETIFIVSLYYKILKSVDDCRLWF